MYIMLVTYMALHHCGIFCAEQVHQISKSAIHIVAMNKKRVSRPCAFSCALSDGSTWHIACHSQEINMGRFYPRR